MTIQQVGVTVQTINDYTASRCDCTVYQWLYSKYIWLYSLSMTIQQVCVTVQSIDDYTANTCVCTITPCVHTATSHNYTYNQCECEDNPHEYTDNSATVQLFSFNVHFKIDTKCGQNRESSVCYS